jgi:L-aspartate oxidase
MGGVLVDSDGRSSLEGLWAVGEVAASGVHGANRLASNSLLEGLVFGPRAARSVSEVLSPLPALRSAERRRAAEVARGVREAARLPDAIILEIRTLMWNHVGVIRDERGLRTADESLERIGRAMHPEVLGTRRNLLLCARMITRAALVRKESLGSHWRSDARASSAWSGRHSVVTLTPGPTPGIVAELDGDPSRRSYPGSMSPSVESSGVSAL